MLDSDAYNDKSEENSLAQKYVFTKTSILKFYSISYRQDHLLKLNDR